MPQVGPVATLQRELNQLGGKPPGDPAAIAAFGRVVAKEAQQAHVAATRAGEIPNMLVWEGISADDYRRQAESCKTVAVAGARELEQVAQELIAFAGTLAADQKRWADTSSRLTREIGAAKARLERR